MNIYKVYIKDNEEHFQIWDNKVLNIMIFFREHFAIMFI